jgi:hypothetical protein
MRHYLRMVNLAIENHERSIERLKQKYYRDKLVPLKQRTATIVAADKVEERLANLSQHRNAVTQDIRLSKDFEAWRDVLEKNEIDLSLSPESGLRVAAASAVFSLSSSTLDRSS